MQTFVPRSESYAASVAMLDEKRLQKQVAEAAQLLRQLEEFPHGGWSHHPAVHMWLFHDQCLFNYFWACIDLYGTHKEQYNVLRQFPELDRDDSYPPWWGEESVHASHAQALTAKWNGGDYVYVWPAITGFDSYELREGV